MSSRWDDFPEASLAGFEARCTRPGAYNYQALEALNNYEAELRSRRNAGREALTRRAYTTRGEMDATEAQDE